jgi:hypothetical protein
MRKSLLAVACGSMLLIGGTAFADDAQTPAAQATTQPVSLTTSPEAKICKAYFHEGMLVRGSCYTRAQWDAQQHFAQDQIENFQLSAARFSPFRP